MIKPEGNGSGGPERRPVIRLASPRSALRAHYDAVVVGSGYGGAVAACRLARMRKPDGSRLSVCVIERGEERQPGEYPDTAAEALASLQVDAPKRHLGPRTALYDFRLNDDLNVFVGCGLGGGSLVNANVSLPPNPRVLDDAAWPSALRADRAGLDDAYSRALEMLRPTPYPDRPQTPAKLLGLEAMARENGTIATRPPLNVHFGPAGDNHVGVLQLPCNDCGDCVSGCNVSAKNTLLMNYLPDAVANGAAVFTAMGVRALEWDKATGFWRVYYCALDSGAQRFDAPESFLTATQVFLAAGSLGSTEILLRSKQRGLTVSTHLGQRFTGNGDVLALVYNAASALHPVGTGSAPLNEAKAPGPCITGLIDLRQTVNTEHGMVIEEGTFPSALAPILPLLLQSSAAIGADPPGSQTRTDRLLREGISALAGPYYGAVDHSQVLLVMAHDSGAGELRLDDDRIRVHWPDMANEAVFERVRQRLRLCAEAVDGALVNNPTSSTLLGERLVSVHPLGGCVMGESVASGVVDDACRVFDSASGGVHPGLYVCDGAVIPRSLGVNPLLTITAIAERALAKAASAHGWTVSTAPTPRLPAVSALTTVGIQFTERMRGTLTRSMPEGTPATACAVTLTITSEDLQALLGDPAHRASIVGTVECALLAPEPMTVTAGVFDLLPLNSGGGNRARRMNYRFTATARSGRAFAFTAYKAVHDDPGPDVWDDTTTLHVVVHHDVMEFASGMMRVLPADFAIQLSTLRVLRAPDIGTALRAKLAFGRFFAGALADTYLGVARTAPRVWPPDSSETAEARRRRVLRLPAAEVHFFRTDDGSDLKLTRYRGGDKGPVILAHGLGVSGRIFTVDTIRTNLAEYLVGNQFDVWILDYRASIDLPAARTQFSADEVAAYDYPAAVAVVRRLSGQPSVQIVAHCFGASTLFMSLLRGLQHVRSAVFSQVAGHLDAPVANQVRAALFTPNILKALGLDALTADLSANPGLLEQLYDRALVFNPAVRPDERCSSRTCNRIAFMYAPLYEHAKLNAATHAALGELFGIANLHALAHLAGMLRAGHVVAADGADLYLPANDELRSVALAHLRFPMLFLHGDRNQCFLPRSTERTRESLVRANPGVRYDRRVILGYGHIDCIFGATADIDVFPYIVEHLERTAELPTRD